MKISNKQKFVIGFIISYCLLLLFGLYVVGPSLMSMQYLLLETVFKKIPSSLVFVSHCSGVVGIATYLAVVFSFLFVSIKTSYKKMLVSLGLLIAYNILRLFVIVYFAIINIKLAEIVHVFSWFLIFVLLILLVLKDYKEIHL